MGIPVLWKPVPGYEGLYSVSSDGKVKSLFRYKKTLTPSVTRHGYETVELFSDGKSKRFLVHRLVALAFIPNPENLPQVNHKDENKRNNHVSNLEWVTAKQNMNHGTRLQRQLASIDYTTDARKILARKNGKVVSKPVVQISGGEVIAYYESAKAASNATGFSHSHICECAKGIKYKHVGGYEWKYAERNDALLVSQC